MSVGRGGRIDFFFENFPAAPKFYDFALYQREGVLGENPFSHGGRVRHGWTVRARWTEGLIVCKVN